MTLYWYFLGTLIFLFVLVLIAVALAWSTAHKVGVAEGRSDLASENAVLVAENVRLNHLLQARPVRMLEVTPQRALPPGTEYTATHKWKAAPTQTPQTEGGQ